MHCVHSKVILVEAYCPIVALESTGVYWKPVYHVLVGAVEVVVGNAQEMQRRPGRKTDKADARWIAELLAHGLIRRIASAGGPSRPWSGWATVSQSSGPRNSAGSCCQPIQWQAVMPLKGAGHDLRGCSAPPHKSHFVGTDLTAIIRP
jgi:Transposase